MSELGDLIRRALKFADWAAGEGICPSEGSSMDNPDEFLFAYSSATDDDDWATLGERIAAAVEAMEAARSPSPPIQQ